MKRLLKLIFKIGLVISLMGILYIQYLKSDYNKSYDKILTQVNREIRNADQVPE